MSSSLGVTSLPSKKWFIHNSSFNESQPPTTKADGSTTIVLLAQGTNNSSTFCPEVIFADRTKNMGILQMDNVDAVLETFHNHARKSFTADNVQDIPDLQALLPTDGHQVCLLVLPSCLPLHFNTEGMYQGIIDENCITPWTTTSHHQASGSGTFRIGRRTSRLSL